MADTGFDPKAHPALLDLGERLRELAGDAAYQSGRDYLKKGLVKQGAVAGATGYATVTGSTDYRVAITFGEEVKVTCTCPAHRRNKHCKHVVAVCSALLERPKEFALTEPPPAPEKKSPRAKKEGAAATKPRKAAAKPAKAELQAGGLETVERLMLELAGGGLMTLGQEKAALLAGAGDLVRSLKLRRLGNLIHRLQRAATGAASLQDPAAFAHLLADLFFTLTATRNHLEGRLALDPQVAEELLGKTWRDEELEPGAGLELIELAYTAESDGEFYVESTYLAELISGEIYLERLITPMPLFRSPKPRHRMRLLVDEAGLYPGPAPRRIKLRRARRAPLEAGAIDRLVDLAATEVTELRGRLIAHLSDPFAPRRIPVLLRPTSLVAQGDLTGLIDSTGRFLPVDLPSEWAKELPPLLPEDGRYALFGLLGLDDRTLRLSCLSLLSAGLNWGQGPLFPDSVYRR